MSSSDRMLPLGWLDTGSTAPGLFSPTTVTINPTDTPELQALEAERLRAERRDERNIVFISSIGHAVCHMAELMFAGVTLAVIAEFDMAKDVATSMAVLGYVLLGIGAIPMGAWADRWGPVKVLKTYFILMSLASLLVAASVVPWHLFVTLTLLGLTASIYHPAGLTMISLGIKKRGRAMGINGVAGSVGQALGPLIGMGMAALGYWRLAYVILAAISLIAAIVVMLVEHKLPAATRAPRIYGPPAPGSDINGAPDRNWIWPLVLLLGATMLGGFNYRAFATALPEYLGGDATGKDLFQGGLKVAMVLLLGGCLGQILGGWAVDRFGQVVYPIFIGSLIPCTLLLGTLVGQDITLGIAVLMAVFIFSQQPAENLLLAEWSDRRRYSLSFGAKFSLTFGFGAIGAPVTGIVWEATGSTGSIFFFVAVSALGMMSLFFWAMRRRRIAVERNQSEELARQAALAEA